MESNSETVDKITTEEQQVTVEDCPETGDAESVAVVKIQSKPTLLNGKQEPKVDKDEVEAAEEVEQVIEKVVEKVTDADENGGMVQVTKTASIVKQSEPDDFSSTTTTTIVKNQVAEQDSGVKELNTTNNTSSNTVKRATGSPETKFFEGDDVAADIKTQVKTQTIITTTPPTPIEEKTTVISSETISEEEAEEEEDGHEIVTEPANETKVVPSVSSGCIDTSAETTLETKYSVPVTLSELDSNQQRQEQTKGDNFNNAVKEIISNIDDNIKEGENIDQLKQQQQELLKKQEELTQQIYQQQLLAQKLVAENKLHQQQLQEQQYQQHLQQQQQRQQYQPQQELQPVTKSCQPQHQNVSKFLAYEETNDENGYTARKTEKYDSKVSSGVSKQIDLDKIFTPATDSEETLPKNRKLYASSAFYSPNLHPTVEDQVELARRISHSLSDISNQTSKGQSMYVNRKKRSVKWVHEGSSQDFQQYKPKPPTSPNILPAYSDAGKHRVQLNIHQEQVLEKYAKPGLKVIKTPWEAALETGSASTAFVEDQKLSPQHTPVSTLLPEPMPQFHDINLSVSTSFGGPTAEKSMPDGGYDYSSTGKGDYVYQEHKFPQTQHQTLRLSSGSNHQRDLAYKPSLPQGWKAPSMSLSKELYMPKEIPLECYAPPPVVNIRSTPTPSKDQFSWKPSSSNLPVSVINQSYAPQHPVSSSIGLSASFPISKLNPRDFSTTSPSYPQQQAKQQYREPTSYQKVTQNISQTIPQVNFNPSPLQYDKLAKFEDKNEQSKYSSSYYSPPQSRNLAINYGSRVRNISPMPFGGGLSPQQQSYSPIGGHDNQGITPISLSPRPSSSQQFSNSYSNDGNGADFEFNCSSLSSARQNFNKSAKGWRNGNASSIYFCPPQTNSAFISAGGSLPYSDF